MQVHSTTPTCRAPNHGRGGECQSTGQTCRPRATAGQRTYSGRRCVIASATQGTGGHTESPVLSTSGWVQDLSSLFDWEVATGRPTVVLDGANISWAYGQAIAKRFKCKAYPSSHGLLLAMHHAPWKQNGVTVKTIMPNSYVQGPLDGIADGCGGSQSLINPEKVVNRTSLWRNEILWEEHVAGRLQLVKRSPGELGRADDDLTVLRVSREEAAFVCSNDLYRQHYRARTGGPGQGLKNGIQLFQNKKRFAQWNSMRHFGFKFNIAPGLSDGMLYALWESMGLVPPAGDAPPGPDGKPAGWDQIKFWDLPPGALPVFFGPEPNMQMLVAREQMLKDLERLRGSTETAAAAVVVATSSAGAA